MTREQAINYLISSGFNENQVGEIVRALTYKPASLSVDEVTAMAEWISKLTEECEVAYNKGYADGKKEQEPKTGHWIGTRRVGCAFGEYKEYIVPIKDGIVTDSCHCSECGEWLTGSDEYECYGNYCPNCGAKMESEVKR